MMCLGLRQWEQGWGRPEAWCDLEKGPKSCQHASSAS